MAPKGPILKRQEVLAEKDFLLKEMTKYMRFGAAQSKDDADYDPDFDAGYTQEDVDCCGELLDAFLRSLEGLPASGRNEWILKNVKATVVALNNLNQLCDGALIETDQREGICAILISAARNAGLKTDVYDIMEEWRQW